MKIITVDVADKSRGVTIRGEIRVEGASDGLAKAIEQIYYGASEKVYALVTRRPS